MLIRILLSIVTISFLFISPKQSLSSQSFVCPPRHGSYQWENVFELGSPGNGTVTFEAKATNDIHVCFSEYKADNSPLYEIVIGGWGNTQSVIRKGRQSPHNGHVRINRSQNPNAMASANEWSTYWVTIKQGLIQVGKGAVSGQNEFLRWQDQDPLLSLKWVCFSSWDTPIEYRKINIQSETQNLFTLKVDAKTHCSDIMKGNINTASHHIPNGIYEVTVKSYASYHGAVLPIKKVMLYITSDDQPYGWFYIAEENKPIQINVTGRGIDANRVYASFIDIACEDNDGYAILSFSRK